MPTPPSLFIGIDAGGTSTRLAYRYGLNEKTLFEEYAGINVERDGISTAITSLTQMIREACLADRKIGELFLCAGMAGAGRLADRKEINKHLSANLSIPETAISIHSDAEIAYRAAHSTSSGILIIVGTGSIVLAKDTKGREIRVGGWGYLLGDEAGGYALGRAGLAAAADSFDHGPQTRITALIEANQGIVDGDGLITYTYNKNTRLQKIAPLVLQAAEEGDSVALQIIETQMAALTARLSWLLTRHTQVNPNVVIFGGISKNDFYTRLLKEQIEAAYKDVTFSSMSQSPLEAALTLAEELAQIG